VYYMVTMFLRSQNHLCQQVPALPLLSVFRDPYFGVAQVPRKSEPETEPEQSIEKAWLTEAKKAKLSNLLKTWGSVEARFFVKSEAEHFIENKRH
jgi:hypothetical protein